MILTSTWGIIVEGLKLQGYKRDFGIIQFKLIIKCNNSFEDVNDQFWQSIIGAHEGELGAETVNALILANENWFLVLYFVAIKVIRI